MQFYRISKLSLILAVLLAAPGCKDDMPDELFEFTHVVDFALPAGLNTFETHFFILPPIHSLVDDQLAATGLDAEVIGSIKPKFCRFSTVFEDIDLDFIRVIEIRLVDQFDPDIRREVFYLDPVPNNTKNVIRPFPGLADVKDILISPSFAVEVRLLFWRPPPQSYDMRVSMEFGAFE